MYVNCHLCRTLYVVTFVSVITVAIMLSLQCCVRRPSSVCTKFIVAKQCIPEQKLLLLTAYRKPYVRNRLVPKWMTLTFLWRSYEGHVNHCVTYAIEYLGNR